MPPEGVANETVFRDRFDVSSRLLFPSSLPSLSYFSHFLLSSIMASQDFVSSFVLAEAQVSSLVELKPAFEHLLRDVGLREVSSNTGWKGLERVNHWQGPVGDHPRESGLSVEAVENRPVYVKSWGSVVSVLSRLKGSGSPFNLGSGYDMSGGDFVCHPRG